MDESFNPYSPPASEMACPAEDVPRIRTIMSRAWIIFRERFAVIALTVMLVWIPCELLSSYMDTYVFAEDDLRSSFKFAQLLDNFFGIIATAGVIYVALQHSSGTSTSPAEALSAGIKAWPQMWWTRFLTTFALVLSLLFLVAPFFYFYPRLFLAETVVVSEGLSGTAAMKRSLELTRGHYWQSVGLSLLIVLIVGTPMALFVILSVFELIPDHWILDASLSVILDIIIAYGTVCLFCMYQAYSKPGTQTVRSTIQL